MKTPLRRKSLAGLGLALPLLLPASAFAALGASVTLLGPDPIFQIGRAHV